MVLRKLLQRKKVRQPKLTQHRHWHQLLPNLPNLSSNSTNSRIRRVGILLCSSNFQNQIDSRPSSWSKDTSIFQRSTLPLKTRSKTVGAIEGTISMKAWLATSTSYQAWKVTFALWSSYVKCRARKCSASKQRVSVITTSQHLLQIKPWIGFWGKTFTPLFALPAANSKPNSGG